MFKPEIFIFFLFTDNCLQSVENPYIFQYIIIAKNFNYVYLHLFVDPFSVCEKETSITPTQVIDPYPTNKA